MGAIYNLGGNRVGAFERRQTATDDIATSWSYAYDALGRLISERRTIDNDYDGSFNGVVDRNVTYEYDRDSNRKKVVDYHALTQETYTHVTGTQRLDRITYSEGKYKQYSWTQNGEMAREDYYENNALKSSQIYTWGFGGTLVEVRFEGGDNDGCKVNYIYDDENELIGRKVTLKSGEIQENERYLVDNLNPTGYSQRLAVVDLKTGHIRHEIFTDELAAETTVNSGSAYTQYPHADGLGSIRALTGKSAEGENLGTDADRHFYDYTAFGTRLRGDRSLTNYAFTGQLAENLMSQQYHRARWLNCGFAGWISIDRVFDYPENYGNEYIYVANNPLSNIDYSGELSLAEVALVAGYVLDLTAQMMSVYSGFKAVYDLIYCRKWYDWEAWVELLMAIFGGRIADNILIWLKNSRLGLRLVQFCTRSMGGVANCRFGNWAHGLLDEFRDSTFGRGMIRFAEFIGANVFMNVRLPFTDSTARPDFVAGFRGRFAVCIDLKPVPDNIYRWGFLRSNAYLYADAEYNRQQATHRLAVQESFEIPPWAIIYLYLPYPSPNRAR